MKRGPLLISLGVSVILIGGAFFTRHISGSSASGATLTVVNTKNTNSDVIPDTNIPSIEPSAVGTSTKPLTNTDLVSRQLLSDYIGLASNGQDSEVNITNLADKYADRIPTLISAPTVQIGDIHIVPNTKANFQSYSQATTQIITTYAQTIKSNPNFGSSVSSGSNISSIARTFSKAYGEAALKLKALATPEAIVVSHQKLINSFLSSAAASDAMAQGYADSATTFAGLVIFNKNLKDEPIIFGEIDKILKANGV